MSIIIINFILFLLEIHLKNYILMYEKIIQSFLFIATTHLVYKTLTM